MANTGKDQKENRLKTYLKILCELAAAPGSYSIVNWPEILLLNNGDIVQMVCR